MSEIGGLINEPVWLPRDLFPQHIKEAFRGLGSFVGLCNHRKGWGEIRRFSPVGNALENPVVIICGKVPGDATQRRFIEQCQLGTSPEEAAFNSVYSDTRMKPV
jgi:hypothetical protein